MPWTWQLKDWPNFRWRNGLLEQEERRFAEGVSVTIGSLRHLPASERDNLAIALLERDALPRQVLRDQVGTALDELRMAVDALQPVHGDLTTVLATLRYRLRPRLEAAGIAIDWQVDELPPIEGLTPTTVLQIQRVLQEAFTNAMRHAQAQRLWVRAWC